MKKLFSSADILLPKFINDPAKAEKWAVVACDQYTSEPEYWEKVYRIAEGNPSAVNIILPEAFLSQQDDGKLKSIYRSMHMYTEEILTEYKDALVYVRRTLSNGKIRSGIVGKVDLEQYDYNKSSVSEIRATEGTVLERIPPRVAVRRGASVELPHIMLLIDDKDNKVISPLEKGLDSFEKLYDFELMLGGGHVEGFLLSDEQKTEILTSLEYLFTTSNNSISLAVGDGNHSLASAKARYEELKSIVGDEKAKLHPLRYALCEVVNLHEDSLEFEPIYRLVRTSEINGLIDSLKAYGVACKEGTQHVKCIFKDGECDISLGAGTHTLTVGTLQNFLDEYKKNNPDIEIDYIHGIDSINKLAKEDNSIGFVFEGMKKEELFDAVERDGALPRKTFSMGEASDKRYYIECRKISE